MFVTKDKLSRKKVKTFSQNIQNSHLQTHEQYKYQLQRSHKDLQSCCSSRQTTKQPWRNAKTLEQRELFFLPFVFHNCNFNPR